MYGLVYLYLHCTALFVTAVTQNFWNNDEFCLNLNSTLRVNQIFNDDTNNNVNCVNLQNAQSKRDNISMINNVKLLCREFDSLTYVWNWNYIKNTTDIDEIIIIVEFMSSRTLEIHSILETRSSYIQINNLKPNNEYAARFRTLINGTINYDIIVDTLIVTTLMNDIEPDSVQMLQVSGFSPMKSSLLETSLTWKPSKDMNCNYKIIYYPQKLQMPLVNYVEVNESFAFVLNNLTTNMKYTVIVQSYYDKTSFIMKSKTANFEFSTPPCWKVENFDFNFCPPGPPYNVTMEETKTPTKNFNVTISWLSPNHNSKVINIIDYFVVKLEEYVKNVSSTMNVVHFDNVSLSSQYLASVQACSKTGCSVETIVRRMPRVEYVEMATVNYYVWTTVVLIAMVLTFSATLAGVGKCVHRQMTADYDHNVTMGDGTSYDMALIKGLDSVEIMLNHEDVIVSDVFLGYGHFGVVKKGVLKTDGDLQHPVAVKSLRDHPSGRDLEEFLGEILLMQKVGKHPNIVSMIGCCLDTNKRCMLIVEYCPLGDLQTYLRKVIIKSWYANDFYVGQTNPIDLIATNKEIESMEPGNSGPMVFNNNCYLYHGEENIFLTVTDLLRFASQTANGMIFLEKNRIVHRDLAARNVLLSDHHTIKICDFGLSRDVYEQNLYHKSNRGGPLPVKWMAIESLKYRLYTTQSDVWSFGILLWEIMMLGGCPYPTISTSRIYNVLCRGYRMPRPTLCCYSLYEVMLECWNSNPVKRPHFSMIKDTIDSIIENQYS